MKMGGGSVCNSSSKELWVGSAAYIRAGGTDTATLLTTVAIGHR